MILLSRAEEIVLLAVYKLKGAAYGVSIRQQIFQDIRKHWSFGAIYKTLKKLVEKGFVEKISSQPVPARGGRSKYYYRITEFGLQELAEMKEIHSSLWEHVALNPLSEKK